MTLVRGRKSLTLTVAVVATMPCSTCVAFTPGHKIKESRG